MSRSLILTMIMLEVTRGVTQNPILTQDYICEEGVVRYKCIVNSTVLQWIVEPIINATGNPIFISSTIDGTVPPFQDGGGNVVIEVKRIDDDPLTATLDIKSNLSGTFDVVCIDFVSMSNESEQHSPNSSLIPPRPSVELQLVNSNSTHRRVRVLTEDADAFQTSINCSESLCNETFDGNENIIVVACGVNLTVEAFTVNECNETSTGISRNLFIECEPGDTTTRDIDSSPSGDTSSVSTTTTNTIVSATGLIAGVVVVVVTLIATAVVIIIIVICGRNRSTRKKITSNTGLELQEAPIMEYNTISSRGYEPDITKDEYSTVRRDNSAGDPTKLPDAPPFSTEYSLLQTSDPTSGEQENGHGGLVYADICVPKHKKSSPHQPIPAVEDRVVYSAIDAKATAKQQQKQGSNSDTSLDLNMMLIQVRAVIPSWFPFGEALGVPVEVLKEVQEMALEDYDKLVEVLDYWFRSFPKGTQPTWRTVSMALQTVGLDELSADIMKVYATGQLPISVSEEVPREAYAGESLPPPPLPPKLEESVGASLPPKPAPCSENGPPRPPKINMSQNSAPPRPPKSSLALKPAAPARPPKPGYI